MKIRNAGVLLLLAAAATGCAFLEALIPGSAAVVNDPAVQEAAGGVVQNLLVGNYIGAASAFGELLFTSMGVYKATMMRRDSLRAKRGEATGAEPAAAVLAPAPAITPEMAAMLVALTQAQDAPPVDVTPGV